MPFLKKLQMMMGMLSGKPTMACADVVDRLFEYLDGELEDLESQQVKDHLEACKKCYPRAEFERAFLEAVQKAKSGATCPEAVRTSVLAAIQNEPEPSA